MQRFLSLGWYDEAIEFLFRFVAKTSEPLLALGLVISAADFLSKGALMQANPSLTMAWAWTQAIAIEASSGVVFVYALQSFKQQDKVKAWLYLILSVLLAITGGAMLLFQLIATTTGLQEANLSPAVFYSMAVLRVLVSVSYVYLCRAKHIRFTDLEDESDQQANSITNDTVHALMERIEQLTVSVTQVTTTVTEITAKRESEQIAIPERTSTNEIESDLFVANNESEQEANTVERIRNVLTRNPELTDRELATLVGVAPSTANKWRKRIEQSA